MIEDLLKLELPVCDHRKPHTKIDYFCTHPKVFSAGFLVTPAQCIACKARLIEATPRSSMAPAPFAANSPESQGQPLPLRRRAANWLAAMARWLAEGLPVCTEEEEDARRGQCWQCEHLIIKNEKAACELCGCCVRGSSKAWLNKLKMATEKCPANPPRWQAIDRQGQMRWYRTTAAVFLRLASKLLGWPGTG